MSSVGARKETVETVLRTARILDLVAAGQREDRAVLIRGEHGRDRSPAARSCPKAPAHAADRGGLTHRRPRDHPGRRARRSIYRAKGRWVQPPLAGTAASRRSRGLYPSAEAANGRDSRLGVILSRTVQPQVSTGRPTLPRRDCQVQDPRMAWEYPRTRGGSSPACCGWWKRRVPHTRRSDRRSLTSGNRAR